MTARKVANQIISNISDFCVGWVGKPIPTHAIQALARSTAIELQEYRPLYECRDYQIWLNGKFVYHAETKEQAQEIVDALNTHV